MLIILIKSYTEKPWRSPETYQLIEDGLRQKWQVKSIIPESPEKLFTCLAEFAKEHNGEIFVFNIAEYIDETAKTGFLPALLEDWGFPHLGSSAEAVSIGLDKAYTKRLLTEQHVPTPRYFVAEQVDAALDARAEQIGYPLIVKPLMEGGHIGIREDSVVKDPAQLDKIVTRVLETHQQPALVEEYLTGPGMREFSVGVIAGKPMLFTPIEIDFAAMDVNRLILSFEAAQNDQERTKPVVDDSIRTEINDLAKSTFEVVGARDYSRVDLRADASGCYVLEINTMPGLGPHSFLPEAAEDIHGLNYAELVQMLAEGSMRRQGIG